VTQNMLIVLEGSTTMLWLICYISYFTRSFENLHSSKKSDLAESDIALHAKEWIEASCYD